MNEAFMASLANESETQKPSQPVRIWNETRQQYDEGGHFRPDQTSYDREGMPWSTPHLARQAEHTAPANVLDVTRHKAVMDRLAGERTILRRELAFYGLDRAVGIGMCVGIIHRRCGMHAAKRFITNVAGDMNQVPW